MVDKLTHLKQLEAESIHIIREVAAEFGMRLGNVIKSPIDGLVKYHNR